MAFTMATAAKGGARSGVAAAIGIGAGSLVWAVATAAGLAALLSASAHAMTVIRIIGGVYLLYLAVQTWRHRRDDISARGADGLRGAFRSGVLTNLFNPKVGLFYLAFLPAFTNAAAGPVWLQILILGAVFSVSGALVLCAVAVAGGALRARLSGSASFRERLNALSAGVFAVLGLWLVSSRPHS